MTQLTNSTFADHSPLAQEPAINWFNLLTGLLVVLLAGLTGAVAINFLFLR
ncbi:MAG: hypothetical protein M3O30_02625 [Planctomycetota bacterium]|nr:hypothetical protein [Planctomycetota bacterium]